MSSKTILRVALFVLCLGWMGVQAGNAQAEIVVIAHPGVTVDGIDGSMLQGIYLGKVTEWDDGTEIIPASLKSGDVAVSFLKTYVKKTSSQFATFWRKAVFSGTGTPPESFESESALVAYIQATEGAIGFIDSATAHDGVKILAVR